MRLLTPAEAATMLRTTPWQVMLACRDGRIRGAVKPFGMWLISERAVETFLRDA